MCPQMLLYTCLSLPQTVMAQYMTRVMMCNVNQKGHNPWPLMHPCTHFQANLAWRLLTLLFTAGRLLSFISALMTYKGTVTFLK